MKFRTSISIPISSFGIQHKDAIFCMGSCFSEHLYKRLSNNKFQALLNPFGTVFHPIAIENSLMRIYAYEKYTEKEIFYYNDVYFSWDHSTLFSSNSLRETLENINASLEQAHEFMRMSKTFVFTLGTAWAYGLKKGDFLVSNCHKIPQSQFEKKLLSLTQIIHSLKNVVYMCKDMHPDARVIFTISPVRHLRDGFVENNQSKALLHLALKEVTQEENIDYFPSYEIVMDELRDYRFFEKDMVHPNELAVDYIWERFSDTYFNERTQALNVEIHKIQMALAHRPINSQSIQHRKFLYDTLKRVEKLAVELPKGTFTKEIEQLKQKIHHVR